MLTYTLRLIILASMVFRNAAESGSSFESADSGVRIAHCLVGAPRGLVPPVTTSRSSRRSGDRGVVPGLADNLLRETLLGLAPRDSGRTLTLFALLHLSDSARKQSTSGTAYDQATTENAIQKLVSDEAHLSIGRIAFSHGGSSCKHPDAQKAVRCCLPGRHPRNFARGMLIGFWVDSCFGMSVAYEQSLAGRAVETGPRPWRFDWFTRSRTDLACLWPLPSLAATTTTTSTRASSSLQGQQLALDKRVAHALPANQVALQPNAVYVLSKELGALWDPLLLIPASFLVAYRNASTFVARRASDADCQNPGRQRVPELPLHQDLVSAGLPIQRLPWPCTIARPATHTGTGQNATLVECARRLKAHAACAAHPWHPPSAGAEEPWLGWRCGAVPPSALATSAAAAKVACAALGQFLWGPVVGDRTSPQEDAPGEALSSSHVELDYLRFRVNSFMSAHENRQV